MKQFDPFSFLSAALLVVALTTAAPAQSASQQAEPRSRSGMAQLGDPYVPPRVRAAARAMVAPPATGASLQTLALGKLRQKFDEADSDASGRISKQRAGRVGFGYVVNHFEAIDVRHRGSISFDDLKTFMRARGARF